LYYDWLLPLPPGRAHPLMRYSGRDAPRAWGEVAVFVRPLKPHSFAWMWLLRVLGLDCRGEPAGGRAPELLARPPGTRPTRQLSNQPPSCSPPLCHEIYGAGGLTPGPSDPVLSLACLSQMGGARPAVSEEGFLIVPHQDGSVPQYQNLPMACMVQ
jgi:hypothetical protein